ncbi:TIGR03619 family F420-dependent LLM class oxidoreductase [Nocardia sp. NPDC051990]|uniref:TIGR03619 family F420-dependent LLM class oxidoreductase n=1 Tax=Nocardia sp. NPDC051990 TaxID=3155285 RepID=UPI00344192B8
MAGEGLRIGFAVPQLGPQAHQGRRIAWFAGELEAAGADSLWVGDRVLAATNPTVGYGGTDRIPAEFHSVLDPFVTLGVAAAATERVRLGTNVLIAPLYRPALLARSLTSIDVISGGRLIAGFGIGWSPEEYAAAEVPFARRGARLDETLDALHAIWSSDPASYQGRYVSVPEHRRELGPVQKPHPPIHLAAFTPAGLARVGRRADGWLPAWQVPGPAGQGGALRRGRAAVDTAARAAGRDPAAVETIVRVNAARGTGPGDLVVAIEAAAAETGFREFFVDLMYVADTVEQAADTALRILGEVR